MLDSFTYTHLLPRIFVKFKVKKMIREEVKQIISQNNFRVLRDKKTHKALGIAYSEDGLKTIANKSGRYLYFDNVTSLKDIPKGHKSNRVYSEKFIPREFSDSSLRSAEMHWIETALHKSYK